MAKPNIYVVGTKVEIDLNVYDTNDNLFIPTYARLSVEEPNGTVVTFSGGLSVSDPELITSSGYLYYLYKVNDIGWYQYEIAAADSTGREAVFTNGFDVIDVVR